MTTARRLACLLLLAAPALAQDQLETSRLPADTTFYLRWRGTASLDAARATNSLLRLWKDPEFAPARKALIESFYASAAKSTKAEATKRDEAEHILSVLENSFLLGFIGSPQIPGTSGAQGGAATTRPISFFILLNTKGKEEFIRKLQERFWDTQGRPTITSYAYGPTTVEKVEEPKDTYYRAIVGSYLIRADQQALAEDLITRLRSPEQPKASLGEVSDYRAALKRIDAGAPVEFFARIPELSKIPAPATERFDAGAFFRALHLEKLHAAAGSLNFAGEATRLRMAALGDTSPRGPFDLVGESSATFATFSLAPAGTTSYSAGRVNLASLYQTLRGALAAGFTSKQRLNMELVEAVVASQIEMEIPNALELLRGEVASLTTAGDFDPFSQLYAATIQKPPQVLRLLRKILAAQISSEEHDGETTYLTLTLPPASGSEKRSYYIGVTPQVLLVCPRMEILREATKRLVSIPAGQQASLAADAAFRRARARLPESLSSLGYFDLTHIPWEQVIEKLRAEEKKKSEKKSSSADSAADWLNALPPGVFRRYLHVVVSGSWKDRDGLYFDGYIE